MQSANSDLQLWEVDLVQSPEWIEDTSSSVLSADERSRSAEADHVRRRRLVARIALRIALAQALDCAPGELTLRRDGSGRPWLDPEDSRAPIHFNLARAGDCCLIAVSRGGPVGVDVEHVVAVPEVEAIVRTRFAGGEAREILTREGADRLRAFFNCWTRKEAYLKARGVGLMAPLDRVVVTVGDEQPGFVSLYDDDPRAWRLFGVPLGSDRVGAVALRNAGRPGEAMLRPEALPLDRSC